MVFATAFWVSPSSRRLHRRCSPSVAGSGRTARGFKHLSRTGVNGKKATRPCPCGYLGSARCRCTPDQVARYRAKLSGPLLDRIDMTLEVPALSQQELQSAADGESSDAVRNRVIAARDRQLERQGKPNAALASGEIDALCAPDEAGAKLLSAALVRLKLSARAYHRVLKLARTVADLAGAARIASPHVAEAIHYRRNLGDN